MNKQQAAVLSVVSNTFLIIFKVIAGISMNSISVLSEAIHSSLDLLASVIAFLSIRKAVMPVDEDHPFGHGKYENLSGFVEAILIFLAAGLIIVEAIKKLVDGGSIGSVTSGLVVMAISAAVNLTISLNLLRISKKTNSIALEADAMHLLTDVFTSLGVFTGLILIKITHISILDPISALLVSILIIKTSFDLTKKSLKDLVDSSLPEGELQMIKDILSGSPDVKDYHKLRTRKSGDHREVDIHVQIDESTSLEQAHRISYEIEASIKDRLENTYVTIHVEPFSKEH